MFFVKGPPYKRTVSLFVCFRMKGRFHNCCFWRLVRKHSTVQNWAMEKPLLLLGDCHMKNQRLSVHHALFMTSGECVDLNVLYLYTS